MNKKDLYQAIGDLDEDTLDVKKQPRHHFGRWVGSIAALLVLAVGLYIWKAPGDTPVLMQAEPSSEPTETAALPAEEAQETVPATEAAPTEAPAPEAGLVSLSSPVYPQMADYPLTSHGMPDSQDDFEAWQSDILAQSRGSEYAKALHPFFAKSMAMLLNDDSQQNRLFSPANLYLSLGMLAEITDKDSRQEILDLLGADSLDALREQSDAVWNAQYHSDKATYMILANSMWLNQELHLNQEPLQNLSQYYYAASFAGKPGSPEMDQALQNWINEQTGGLLSQQAKDLHLDPNTVIALASTLRYQAKWVTPFREAKTQDLIFNTPSGPETVPFLCQDMNTTYYWADSFGAVPLNLQNGGGTMWLIRPQDGTGPQALLQDPALYDFLQSPLTGRQKNATVHLSLPRFDVSSSLDLSQGLQDLGVRQVFGPEADFTPLVDPRYPDGLRPALSQCSHAVRVAVDEEGVTAAAYTEMGMTSISAPPPDQVDFMLDHPFLFVITSNDGLPLFAGVVNHP